MRKTFLKVALIGLLVGSLPVGFTSCKDYDDDINNLENQTSDLKTKLASVETAIAALPSKADVTAAQAAAVAQAKADLETVKAQLQAAIDGKADKEEVAAINDQLSNIKGQLETIEALKAEITASMTALDGAIKELNTKAEAQGQLIAGIQAQIGELSEEGVNGKFDDITKELEALKSAVTDPSNGLDALKAEIAKLAEQIQGQGGPAASLEATLRVINGMVTSLRFVSNPTDVENGDLVLELYNPVKVDALPVGPDNEALLFDDLKVGAQKDFEDAVLVQVSPAGAVLNADNLSLVDSEGNGLKGFVTIKSVEAYKGLLTGSRAVSTGNGLYKVTFTQDPGYKYDTDKVDEETGLNSFQAATQVKKGEYIRYALAVSETNEAGARDVMTPYDLIVEGGDLHNQYGLNYKVNDTPVAEIHNRYSYAEDNSSYMYKGIVDGAKKMDEVYKAGEGKVNYTASLYDGWKPVGDYAYTTDDGKIVAAVLDANDDRTGAEFLTVKVGEAFEVAPVVATGNTIYGYYVTLDLLRATESNGSERGEWRIVAPYITNLNTVVKGSEPVELTITADAMAKDKGELEEGDILGFRVWAVNYDGTLVDPDGRAFYVMVGEAKAPASTFNAAIPVNNVKGGELEIPATGVELGNWITANEQVNVEFAMDALAGDITPKVITITTGDETPFVWSLAAPASDATDKTIGKVTNPKAITFKLGSKNAAGSATKAATVTNFNEIFKNMTVEVSNASIPDGQTYKGTFTITNANGRTLQEVTVNITKVLPRTVPAGFGFKSGLVPDGETVLVDYVSLAKNNYNASAVADLSNVFNWGIKPGTESEPTPTALNANSYTSYYQVTDEITSPVPGVVATPAYFMSNNWGSDVVFKTDFVNNDGKKIYTYNSTTGKYEETPKTTSVSTANLINSEDAVPFIFYYTYEGISYKKASGAKTYAANNLTRSKTLNIEFRTVSNSYSFAWATGVNVKLDRNKAVSFATNGVQVTSTINGMPTQTLYQAMNTDKVDWKLNLDEDGVVLSDNIAEWYEISEAHQYESKENTTIDKVDPDNVIAGIPTKVVGTGANATRVYVAGKYTYYTIEFTGKDTDFPTVGAGTIDFTFLDGITILDANGKPKAQTIKVPLAIN